MSFNQGCWALCREKLIFACSFILLLLPFTANANELTPANEPKDDSFYVCYEKRCDNEKYTAVVVNYKKYKYIGCVISRLPCHLYCQEKSCHPPKRLKQFYWYSNYYDALNGFYRCAYS